MIQQISAVIPFLVVVSHVLLVVLLLSVFGKNGWGRKIFAIVGDHAVLLGFLVTVAATAGSLFYSDVVGFEACVLCWWQRVFLYPQVIIFGIALWKKDTTAFLYAVPLTLLATIVALYQAYANLGLGSFLPCTAAGGACSKIYINEFGYITIPVMSLTVCLCILLIAWIKKLNENSNA